MHRGTVGACSGHLARLMLNSFISVYPWGVIMRKLGLVIVAALAMGVGVSSSWAKVLIVDAENGTDSGPNTTCGPSLSSGTAGPCASLNQALNNATTNDVINIVHGALFGPILINHAISIVGPPDNSASIVWSATPPGCVGAAPGSATCGSSNATYAIDVEAGTTDIPKIKNLVVNAAGNTNGAIHIGAAEGMTMNSIGVRGGPGAIPEMILVNPSAPGANGQFQLYLKDCDIAFSSSGGGLLVQPSGSTPTYVGFTGGEVHNAKFGVRLDSTSLNSGVGIQTAIDNTEFFAFSNSAVIAVGTGSGNSNVLVARSTVLDTNGPALQVNGSNAHGLLFETAITGNKVGVNVSGGSVATFGNNEIFANGNNCESGGVPAACTAVLTSEPLN